MMMNEKKEWREKTTKQIKMRKCWEETTQKNNDNEEKKSEKTTTRKKTFKQREKNSPTC